MEILTAPAQALVDTVCLLLERWPMAGQWYMAFIRFVFPVLAILIVFRAVRSLLRIPHTPETWGQLSLPNGTPHSSDPLGEYHRPEQERRCVLELPQHFPPARGAVPRRG
ncbi:MAG: hypothetical protein V8R55_02000 [Dysosmobacter sp.]